MLFNDTYDVGFVAVLGCCNLQVLDKVINVVFCSTSVKYIILLVSFPMLTKHFPELTMNLIVLMLLIFNKHLFPSHRHMRAANICHNNFKNNCPFLI